MPLYVVTWQDETGPHSITTPHRYEADEAYRVVEAKPGTGWIALTADKDGGARPVDGKAYRVLATRSSDRMPIPANVRAFYLLPDVPRLHRHADGREHAEEGSRGHTIGGQVRPDTTGDHQHSHGQSFHLLTGERSGTESGPVVWTERQGDLLAFRPADPDMLAVSQADAGHLIYLTGAETLDSVLRGGPVHDGTNGTWSAVVMDTTRIDEGSPAETIFGVFPSEHAAQTALQFHADQHRAAGR